MTQNWQNKFTPTSLIKYFLFAFNWLIQFTTASKLLRALANSVISSTNNRNESSQLKKISIWKSIYDFCLSVPILLKPKEAKKTSIKVKQVSRELIKLHPDIYQGKHLTLKRKTSTLTMRKNNLSLADYLFFNKKGRKAHTRIVFSTLSCIFRPAV